MQSLNDFFQTATVAECAETLDFWLNECSLDQSPEPITVAGWQQLFQQRQGKFMRLAQICQQWLEKEQADAAP